MRLSIVSSALVAVLVGFGSSVAIVISAANAVGASPAQTTSWVAALCLATGLSAAILSYRHRMPIVAAWSTPGAALIAVSTGVTIETAVGAFLLSAALIIVTAAFRPIGALVSKLPTAIASAMLAGVLFGFVLAVFQQLPTAPQLVLPLIVAFVVIRLFSPSAAVLIVIGMGIALCYILGLAGPLPNNLGLSQFELVTPVFDLGILIGLGLPLYLVTMAGQNLPGFAVLKADGYDPPAQSILGVTGIASLLSAPFCAHTSNLAAITAAICTGPDVHPDPKERWRTGLFYALGYAFLTLFGASLVALFGSFPQALVITIAGIALAGPLVSALGTSLSVEKDRFAAVLTFVVTASGLGFFGIGSAFWGLVAGLSVFGLERAWSRLRS